MKISDISVDISDIGDVRHDIGDDRYIVDISVLDRYIRIYWDILKIYLNGHI